MQTLILFGAWLRAECIMVRRYAFNVVILILTGYSVFMLIFLGVRVFGSGGTPFGETVGGLIVGFMVLSLVYVSFRRAAHVIMEDAMQGTLEQQAMAPIGLTRGVMVRLASYQVIALAITGVQLLLMMLTTRHWLNLDLVSMLPLLLLTVASSAGVGLMMGGLALVYKRVDQSFQMVGYMLLGLSMVPAAGDFTVLKFAPISWGAELLRRVLVHGQTLAEIPIGDLLFLVGNASVYLVAGATFFWWMEQRARRLGTLGLY